MFGPQWKATTVATTFFTLPLAAPKAFSLDFDKRTTVVLVKTIWGKYLQKSPFLVQGVDEAGLAEVVDLDGEFLLVHRPERQSQSVPDVPEALIHHP